MRKRRLFPHTRTSLLLIAALGTTTAIYSQGKHPITDPVRYVDPFIGTGFHGHVFLGASVPFGAVQLGPENLTEGWDWCSGYHISDSTIIGFSHTHLSGTGIGDLGDLLLMPATGTVPPYKGKEGAPQTGYYSFFEHKNETCRPGYYSVLLDRYQIKAELTTTERVGFHRYTFPASDSAQVIINLKQGIGWDRPVKTMLRQVNDTTIAGYRTSTGWAHEQHLYFTILFSKPIRQLALFEDTQAHAGDSLTAEAVNGIAYFSTRAGEQVTVKVGLSPVSIENAMANIQQELPGRDFDGTVTNATRSWNKELGKVMVSMSTKAQLRSFYTALYHTMIAPSVFNDHNGDYLGTDKKVYHNASFTNLTTFSLWDTYRAANPLFTVLQPERVNDVINSFLAIYQQQGALPVWHLMGNETYTMPGNSSVQVVADAYLKGFRGFDTTLAYEAVKATQMQDKRGLRFLKQYGYIPADSMVEAVAMGLEYAISDAGVAQMAQKMGTPEEYAYFNKRAHAYQYYFDPVTRFMRGRLSLTEWRTPFSPFESKHRKDDFAEGNSWQYTWLVPQDVPGLVQLMGGPKAFVQKLDSLFTLTHSMGDDASSDITGLIGQYAHGNEPGHHIPYLYTCAGAPWKTAQKVRYIMDSLYSDRPDGLCGNEDVGQMSAWYVFSALGFYQVNPSSTHFVLGSPLVNDAVIALPGHKTMHIKAVHNSATNIYVQSVQLNGQPLQQPYLSYRDLMQGGTLTFTMGPRPSATWGVQ